VEAEGINIAEKIRTGISRWYF